ncbi:MAG: DUF5683 domain-containing protein [Bacteroidaceae bacterium]
MILKIITYRWTLILFICFLPQIADNLSAQNDDERPKAQRRRELGHLVADSIPANADSLAKMNEKRIDPTTKAFNTEEITAKLDSINRTFKVKKLFVPDSKKATWLAVIFPGGGQIYNRKFWKLPIIYGGFIGCAYALNWNQKYYSDYSQAYLDIMDDDPKSVSYLNFLPINYDITGREDWLKEVFKNKKNTFRRQRDLSIFAFIGVYLVSIIDAYVDAELSNFDITPDIGLHIEPAILNDQRAKNKAFGLQCSINFK